MHRLRRGRQGRGWVEGAGIDKKTRRGTELEGAPFQMGRDKEDLE